jgi:hypothetical protein
VVRIQVERRFEVSVRGAFDYVTDHANWPAYWPRFVRLDPDRAGGSTATARASPCGCAPEVELDMKLSRIEPCRAGAVGMRSALM